MTLRMVMGVKGDKSVSCDVILLSILDAGKTGAVVSNDIVAFA